MRICVAGVPIDIENEDKAYFARRFAAYLGDPSVPAQMRMTSATCAHIEPPVGEEQLHIRRSTVLRLPDGRGCHYTRWSADGPIYQCTCYSAENAAVDILLSIPQSTTLTDKDYEYAYTGYEFANRLGYLGGTVLHGSAIAYRGQGVVFSAPSGTGKSTHTALWKQCFGDDVQYVNDDKPALRFDGAETIMYGTPWSGKTELNQNIAVPLRAVVFLERGEHNAIKRLDTTQAMFYLSGEVVRPYHDAVVSEKLVDAMLHVAQSVPAFLLTCNMDPAAALIARNGIFHE